MKGADINREIYNSNYSDENLRFNPQCPYDERIIALRMDLIRRHAGSGDVLDLCCGTGSYLIPTINIMNSAVGVDFSSNMLAGFMKNLGGTVPGNLSLIEADAMQLPMRDALFDFVYSFTSLYYIPRLGEALAEVSRVLRPGGIAALEMGNLHSLNTIVCNVQHRELGWARPFLVSYSAMTGLLKASGFRILERYSFQLLPMYGAPPKLRFLSPLLSPSWKRLMGLRAGDVMLDNVVSGCIPFRYISYRHIFVVRKDEESG